MPVLDDTWAVVPIGHPFPSNPVRVMGENNLYVALWYKHGVPVCGSGWNNGGVVECSFSWNGKELTGVKQLGGEIQILTYMGDYNTNGYFYEWVPLKDSRQAHLQMVRCGDSAPIVWVPAAPPGNLGNLCISKEIASFSSGGMVRQLSGDVVKDMLVLCRNTTTRRSSSFRSDELRWLDVNEGDPLPPGIVSAPSDDNTFVAVWFKSNEVVMGRCWSQDGRLSASFACGGKEIRKDIGSFQVLQYTEELDRNYDLEWIPLKDARSDGWWPVHVRNVAPCVIKDQEGTERLGKVWLMFEPEEMAVVAWDNKVRYFDGPEVQTFQVLCRKTRPKPQLVEEKMETSKEPDVEETNSKEVMDSLQLSGKVSSEIPESKTSDFQPTSQQSETSEIPPVKVTSLKEIEDAQPLMEESKTWDQQDAEVRNLEETVDSQPLLEIGDSRPGGDSQLDNTQTSTSDTTDTSSDTSDSSDSESDFETIFISSLITRDQETNLKKTGLEKNGDYQLEETHTSTSHTTALDSEVDDLYLAMWTAFVGVVVLLLIILFLRSSKSSAKHL